MGCQNSAEVDNPLKIKYHFSPQLLFPINNPESTSRNSKENNKANQQILDTAIAYYQQFIERNPSFNHPFDGLGCPEEVVGCLEGKIEEWYKSGMEKGTIIGNPYDALSLCYCLKGNYGEGQSWYLEMIEKNPDVCQLYFGLGNIYYGMSLFDKSQQNYRKALQINPRLQKAYQNMAFIYCYHLYDNSQASQWSSFALKLNPSNHYAALVRELVREDIVKRVQNLTMLVRKYPTYARIYNALGTTHIQLEEYCQAVKWFEKGMKINQKYHALHYGLALTYNKVGMADEAIKLSHRTLESDPSHHEPYSSLGQAYTAKGNLSEAEEWYKKCIEVNQHFYPAYCQLAKMYIREERICQAMKLLDEALEINPDLIEALFLLGKLNIEVGNKGQGLSLFQRVLQIEYDNEAIIKFMKSYWDLDEEIKTEDGVEQMKIRLLKELEECFGLGEIEEAHSEYQAEAV